MNLSNKNVVVVGGSRGLGLGLVEALVARGATVTVVARESAALAAVRERLGVATAQADATDADAARRILADVQPELVFLNAGAPPVMRRLDQLSWDEFGNTWNTDVKAGFHWVQALLQIPLPPGSRVVLTSSGAAINGSPMSGAYAGAKRMLWIMAGYANKVAGEAGVAIRFQVVVPRQMVAATGVGEAGSTAYARAQGISKAQFLERFGTPMTPRGFGDMVLAILENPEHESGFAFAVSGATGITQLEEATT